MRYRMQQNFSINLITLLFHFLIYVFLLIRLFLCVLLVCLIPFHSYFTENSEWFLSLVIKRLTLLGNSVCEGKLEVHTLKFFIKTIFIVTIIWPFSASCFQRKISQCYHITFETCPLRFNGLCITFFCQLYFHLSWEPII